MSAVCATAAIVGAPLASAGGPLLDPSLPDCLAVTTGHSVQDVVSTAAQAVEFADCEAISQYPDLPIDMGVAKHVVPLDATDEVDNATDVPTGVHLADVGDPTRQVPRET